MLWILAPSCIQSQKDQTSYIHRISAVMCLLDAGPVSFRVAHTMKIMDSSEGKPTFISSSGENVETKSLSQAVTSISEPKAAGHSHYLHWQHLLILPVASWLVLQCFVSACGILSAEALAGMPPSSPPSRTPYDTNSLGRTSLLMDLDVYNQHHISKWQQ